MLIWIYGGRWILKLNCIYEPIVRPVSLPISSRPLLATEVPGSRNQSVCLRASRPRTYACRDGADPVSRAVKDRYNYDHFFLNFFDPRRELVISPCIQVHLCLKLVNPLTSRLWKTTSLNAACL